MQVKLPAISVADSTRLGCPSHQNDLGCRGKQSMCSMVNTFVLFLKLEPKSFVRTSVQAVPTALLRSFGGSRVGIHPNWPSC